MCEPTSIILGTSAVLGLAGGIMKGSADKAAADATASQDERNAIQAKDAASDALQRGSYDAGRVQMKAEQIEGAQRAGYAAGNVEVDTGTAARTGADTASISAMDMATIKANAAREAWGYETQSTNYEAAAQQARAAGSAAEMDDIIGGAAGSAVAFGGKAVLAGFFQGAPSGIQPIGGGTGRPLWD